MRILWLTNVIPEVVAEKINVNKSFAGGWITGLFNSLKNDNLAFCFCFPVNGKAIEGKIGTNSYHGFSMKKKDYLVYSERITKYLKKIVLNEQPDVIHVFGTEFPYVLSMVKACEELGIEKKVILNVQGLVSEYKKHFFAGIPNKVRYGMTLKELIRKNNLEQQYKYFCQRSNYEIEAFKRVKYIIGRTEWDKACTFQINAEAKYFHVNETMRNSFYEKEWKYENCEKKTVFISQGNYPIKGLHAMLEAFSIVVKKHPDACIKIAGEDIILSLKNLKKRTTYAKYIREKIKMYNLEKNIEFLGALDEDRMCNQYLKANVFVSPSSIENSSNSVSEALLLGVPVIASNVGGISTLIEDRKEGILYPFTEPNMLAFHIIRVFEYGKEIEDMTKCARIGAERRFSKLQNAEKVKEVYNIISKGE